MQNIFLSQVFILRGREQQDGNGDDMTWNVNLGISDEIKEYLAKCKAKIIFNTSRQHKTFINFRFKTSNLSKLLSYLLAIQNPNN